VSAGVRVVKIAAAVLVLGLWIAVAWASSEPRYVIREGKVTYPWLRDALRVTELPVVVGPATDAWEPWRVTQASEILVWGWRVDGPGRLALGPSVASPGEGWARLLKVSDDARVSGYGMAASRAELLLRGFPVPTGRGLVILCPRGPVVVRGDRVEVRRAFGEVYLILERGSVIAVLPERAFRGVYVWRPRLRWCSSGSWF